MIYVDRNAQPNEIARTLWRELGPERCIAIALSLVNRDEQQLLVIDVTYGGE